MVGTVLNRRNTLVPIEAAGLWIECCYRGCKKWRHCTDYEDPVDVPEKWYCPMNSDEATNKCSVPESSEISEHEEFVLSKYKAGSIVWAKVVGHPWSPAMVDFCPEYESYYWFDGDATEPTQYHVTFLSRDNVTRAWIKSGWVKPFVKNQDPSFALNTTVRSKKLTPKMKSEILEACEIAEVALRLSLINRLKRYDFEAWTVAKRTQDLLETTPGIVPKLAPPAKIPKKHRKSVKTKKATDPSNLTLRNRKVSPELDAPPPNDRTKRTKKKVASKATRAVKKSSKKKQSAESYVQNSDSARTDTPTAEKESPDLDDTRSVHSVFTDPTVQLMKQTVEINSEDVSSMKTVSVEKVDGSVGEFVSNSESQSSFTLRVSEEDVRRDENKLSDSEEFEVVFNSPEESRPGNLSLKLKSINDSRMRNCETRKAKANSEDFGARKDKRKGNRNKPEDSKYLRALSEFNINGNKKYDYKLLNSRPLQRQKQLPEWSANREKRNEVLAQRANKLMSEISIEEDSNMYKENRENFIAEQQRPGPSNGRDPRLIGPSNSRDPRLRNNDDRWQMRKSLLELFTSDDDSS